MLWRLSGLCIAEIGVIENVKLASFKDYMSKPEFKISQTQNSQFSLERKDSILDLSLERSQALISPKILTAIAYNLRNRNIKLQKAAFRLIGVYFTYLENSGPQLAIQLSQAKSLITKEIEKLYARSGSQFSILISECCCRFPSYLLEPNLLYKISGLIIRENGFPRSRVFNILETVFKAALERQELYMNVSTELIQTIQASLDKILRDTDKYNILEFLKMMIFMAKLRTEQAERLLQSCLKQLSDAFFKALEAADLPIFFEFVLLVFELYKENHKIHKNCLGIIVSGLGSPNKIIRKQILEYLEANQILPLKEEERLEFILENFYNPETEQSWLTTSSFLLLSAYKSSNLNQQLLFQKPLTGYVSTGIMKFGGNNNRISNFSQPMIPLSLLNFSQNSQIIPKSQNYSFYHGTNSAALNLPTQANQEQREALLLSRAKYALGTQSVSKFEEDEMSSLSGFNIEGQSETSRLSGRSVARSMQQNKNFIRKSSKAKEMSRFIKSNNINWLVASQLAPNQIRIEATMGRVRGPGLPLPPLQEVVESETLREYKEGELPDIQIKVVDLLAPLLSLCTSDAVISQEILVTIFVELYKDKKVKNRQKLLNLLFSIISKSKSDYQVINTIQTILYELSLQSEQLQIDAGLIARTGTGSLSLGGAALLLEELLSNQLKNDAIESAASQQTQRIMTNSRSTSQGGGFEYEVKIESKDARDLVFQLIDIYKKLKEEDILKGLYRCLHRDNKPASDVIYFSIFRFSISKWE